MSTSDYIKTLCHPVYKGQGVRERRWYFCRAVVETTPVSDLVRTCSYCGQFFARCCRSRPASDLYGCHHLPVVYTDGACRNNGRRGAVQEAGLGIASGTSADHQLSIPVDDSVDPGAARTSQRAELLAAIQGIHWWGSRWVTGHIGDANHGQDPSEDAQLIIATDSEYVCKGMCEWYPKWEKNGWKASNGVPKNLDLFHRLDGEVTQLEGLGVKVGFLHLQREVHPSPTACYLVLTKHASE
ncbi:hypothetical protein AURDEDRAFT_53303 [Auricularia subglabra TFB-10046 SS5]|nr:hypothetical protein AURDEDRAFT_53303 [Auricularia subglabra TFB-10046 SS5]